MGFLLHLHNSFSLGALLDTPPKQNGRPLLFQCINTFNGVFLTLCLLINALDVASPLVMPIVFLNLQLHSGEHGRLALSYLQFV